MALYSYFRQGGRGIVVTAGNGQAPFLLAAIPVLRKLGCTLPVEVMYLGDSDLGEVTRRALDAFDGVTTRDMAPMIDDKDWKVSGWAAKPFAILFSTFREVIFIDADALFFRDPETLFDDPGYKTTGALFFRDRLFMPESKKSWLQQVLPKPVSKQVKRSRPWTGDSGHMQESGVIVVDKVRHFVALLMVTRMNGPDRDGNKDKGRVGIYDMVYGDKETFWLGWELVGDVAYAFHQGDAGTMGVTQGLDSKVGGDGEILQKKEPTFGASKLATYRICSPQLIHLDLDGSPIWFNDWLLENKFVVRNQRVYATFEQYLIEPRSSGDPGGWELRKSNICCLTADSQLRRNFTTAEKVALQLMLNEAKKVDTGEHGLSR